MSKLLYIIPPAPQLVSKEGRHKNRSKIEEAVLSPVEIMSTLNNLIDSGLTVDVLDMRSLTQCWEVEAREWEGQPLTLLAMGMRPEIVPVADYDAVILTSNYRIMQPIVEKMLLTWRTRYPGLPHWCWWFRRVR